jgi:predicted RNA-binding Zn ribbon-like protein
MNVGITQLDEPGEREPAPGPVRLVQRFINTLDREGPEVLPDARALKAWLVDARLLDQNARVTTVGHRRAIELREALRALAYANGGHPPDPDALATVNAAARRAGLQPMLTGAAEGAIVPAARGLDAALGRIVAAVHAGIADGTWARLKACERETCRWAFYDHSRNRAGHWCSMAVCGSREKNRRAYRRRRGRDATARA